MKNLLIKSKIVILLFSVLIVTSCNSQTKTIPLETENVNAQIGEYIVEMAEDTKGNLWFGTIDEGIAKYDGKELIYWTTKDGLSGNRVTSFAEDANGNIWLGTGTGLIKYNGKQFTIFTEKDGLCSDNISHLLIDKTGTFWIGTWGGVCQFDGSSFTNFPLPNPDIKLLPYQTTMNWISELSEDSKGNIWIGRDGYGACKYDGTSFTHFTKKEGLPSNNVHAIQEDNQGNIWFGSRVSERDHADPDKRFGEGGLSKYDGNTIVTFPEEEGLSKNDVYAIYKDRAGEMWVSTTGHGVYKYDGNSFTNFKGSTLNSSNNSPPFGGVQNILEDSNGNFWFGCSGGLFRLKENRIVNVTKEGPWD